MNFPDPNAILGTFTLLGALGTWLYAKVRGEKTRDLGELVLDHVLHQVEELLDSAGGENYTPRLYLEEAAYQLTDRMKLKRKAVRPYVDKAVERGMLVFARTIRARRNQLAAKHLPQQASAIATAANEVLQEMQRAELRGLEQNPFEGITVERVKE